MPVSTGALQQVLDVTGDIASKTLEIREGVSMMQAALTVSSKQLNKVVTNTSETVSGIQRTEAGIDNLFERMSAVTTTATDNFTGLQECLLGQIRAEFANQMQSQELLFSGISHVIGVFKERLRATWKRTLAKLWEEKSQSRNTKGNSLQSISLKSGEQEVGEAASAYRRPGIRVENEPVRYIDVSTIKYRIGLLHFGPGQC